MNYADLRARRKRVRRQMKTASKAKLPLLKEELKSLENSMSGMTHAIGDVYAAMVALPFVPSSTIDNSEGPCKLPTDKAADGSSCGGRSPGGKSQNSEVKAKVDSYLLSVNQRASDASSLDEMMSILDEPIIADDEISSYLKNPSENRKPSFDNEALNWIVDNAGEGFDIPFETDNEGIESTVALRMIDKSFASSNIDGLKDRLASSDHPLKDIESLIASVDDAKFNAKKTPELSDVMAVAKEIEKKSEYGFDPSEPTGERLRAEMSDYYDEQVDALRSQTPDKVAALRAEYKDELSALIKEAGNSEGDFDKLRSQFTKRVDKIGDHNSDHGLLTWAEVADDPDPKRYKTPKFNSATENWLAQFGDATKLLTENDIDDLIDEIRG